MRERSARRSTAGAIGLALAGAIALLGAVVLQLTSARSAPRPAAVPVVDRGTLPSGATGSAPTGSAPTGFAPRHSVVRHELPTGSRVQYARLGLDAAVVRVQAPGRVVDVPRNPAVLGWWRGGAAPGDSAGSAVVVGHVNYAGVAGALAVLPRARPGDRVRVVEPHARLDYRVVAVRTYAKSRGIPAAAFARSGSPRLVLITCGGPFDPSTGNYEDNVVVYAVAV